ncbi:hypothetical protein C5612_07940 [Pseudomonas frederiksbergensis]|uniref:Uncharacterized protein n=1 Tax=Pseudomonas frederiksbergensis TaxID=104087 RepID=A0A2S8HQH8_9PSED|nr:hypothetical protein C5612_07940 [Pseudomonas frederiksbergensis]
MKSQPWAAISPSSSTRRWPTPSPNASKSRSCRRLQSAALDRARVHCGRQCGTIVRIGLLRPGLPPRLELACP